MKQQEEKKLRLRKETIRDLDRVLDKEEQQRVKGGTQANGEGPTQVPIYC